MKRPIPIPAVVDPRRVERYAVDEVTGCWNWTGPTSAHGRAVLSIQGVDLYAYRVSYTVHVGLIPDGLQINHHCDNPRCINPEHLYAGTALDNVRDAWARGRARVNPVLGEDHPHAKFTEDDIRAICERYARREATQAQLAAEYEVAPTRAWKAARRAARRNAA